MLPFRFYLITDRLHGRHDPLVWLRWLEGAGLAAVQVREKDLPPAKLFRYGREIQAALGEAGTGAEGAVKDDGPRLYLNDRTDLALSLGFAGVHLREDSLPLADHGRPLRRALSFGVSCHDAAGVSAAARAGADFATIGPVYPTPSKAAYGAPLGVEGLAEAVRAAQSARPDGAKELPALPLLALGGVTPGRVAECLDAGAHGVAAISAVWDAPDPLAALAAFRDALGGL